MTNGLSLAKTNQPHPNGRGVLTALAAGIAVILITLSLVYFPEVTQAQRRNPRRQRRPTTQPSIDYSKFSHATKKHTQACNTCHKVPTRNWQKAGDFPDVADYPDHDACIACHRRQFFRGARPPICTVCHSRVSPRDDARFTFRDPAGMRQFSIEFPHDKHQDVIARVRPAAEFGGRVDFRAASFKFSAGVPSGSERGPRPSIALGVPYPLAWKTHAQDDKAKIYNNCVICHASGPRYPLAPAGGWIDSFAPDAVTFKAVPTSHASCFNCHWKSQPPVNNDCGGCHKPATPYRAIASPTRISMKFRHGREQHVRECTACHINITKASTLRGLEPDVPITSCTECHNKDGLRLDVATELQAVDKNREFACIYCHTSDVGRRDPPASHYVIAERQPIKRSGIK
ncbi:MAG: cytochrome c3 family protein [Pyrinomonadaceae bacterium]|nr:cytochrome c3 family protein [Pyrinomonadaceae bacterium]